MFMVGLLHFLAYHLNEPFEGYYISTICIDINDFVYHII
jgi:hypothetical protein